MKRIFLIVLDSCGIGEEPDAAEFGDAGSNTLRACAASPVSVSHVPIPAPMISNWRIRVPPFYAISLSVSSAACTVQARSFCVCTDETNIASN